MDYISPKDSFWQLLKMIKRKRFLFIACFGLFATGIFVASHYVPLKYTGKAIFEFGIATAAEEISRTSSDSFGTIKERLAHDLAGYQAVEQGIVDLGLTEGLPRDPQGNLTEESKAKLQKMVEFFMQSAQVSWEARSQKEDLVALSFTHEDSKLAQDIPNILVRNYINNTYERILDGLKRQYDFLQHRCDDAEKHYQQLSNEKITFETQNAGMLPNNPAGFQDKIERANIELSEAKRRREIARLQLARMEGLKQIGSEESDEQDPSASKIVRQPNPEINRLKGKLQELEDELETAVVLNHMTEEHPLVKALRLKIQQTNKRIEQTPAEIVSEAVFTSGADLVELSMTSAAVKSESETAENEIQRLEALLGEYNKKWENYAPVRQKYLAHIKKVDDALGELNDWKRRVASVQMALAAAVENRLTRLNTVQVAHKQYLPSWPTPAMIIALALVGGLGFAVGIVFVINFFDTTITTCEDIPQHFDIPVCGVISKIESAGDRFIIRFRQAVLMPAVSLIILAAMCLVAASAILRVANPPAFKNFWESSVKSISVDMNMVLNRNNIKDN